MSHYSPQMHFSVCDWIESYHTGQQCAHPWFRHLQAAALVCYEVREVRQSEAVPEVEQRHGVQSQISTSLREKDIMLINKAEYLSWRFYNTSSFRHKKNFTTRLSVRGNALKRAEHVINKRKRPIFAPQMNSWEKAMKGTTGLHEQIY